MALEAVQAQAGHPRSSRPASTCTSPTTGSPSEYRGRGADRRRHRAELVADAGDQPGGAAADVAVQRRSRPSTSQPEWAQLGPRRPSRWPTDAPLPGAGHHVPRPTSVESPTACAAPVRPLAPHHTDITIVADIDRRPHRGLQGVARRPARPEGAEAVAKNTQRQRLRMIRIFFERLIEWDWPDAPAGTRSCTATSHPAPNRSPSSSTTRRRPLMAAARSHPGAPLPARRRGPRPHRPARRRALRPRRRRRHPDRRRPLAARPGRQAPQRPHDPLHPDLVDLFADWTATNLEHIRPARGSSPTTTPPRPAHRAPHRRPHRPPRRHRRHPPPPAPPHPRHPGHQPGHAPRSDRRPPRPPLDGDDPHLRPHRRPCRRRRIRRRQRPDRRPLRTARPAASPRSRPPRWPGSATKPTPACSATACAPAPSSSTAAWKPSAKPAPTSPPDPSSCPSCSDNETTPAPHPARPRRPLRHPTSQRTP